MKKAEADRKLRAREKKKKVVAKKIPKRRVSFSEGLLKYNDVVLMRNPLRERLGPSIKDAVTITQMQKYMRYPVPELLLRVPDKYNLFFDSIISAAYDAEEIKYWTSYR